jgi:hypothetical protein
MNCRLRVCLIISFSYHCTSYDIDRIELIIWHVSTRNEFSINVSSSIYLSDTMSFTMFVDNHRIESVRPVDR